MTDFLHAMTEEVMDWLIWLSFWKEHIDWLYDNEIGLPYDEIIEYTREYQGGELVFGEN